MIDFCNVDTLHLCLNSKPFESSPHGKSPFGRGVFGDIFEVLFTQEGVSGFHNRKNAADIAKENVQTQITVDLADSDTGANRFMTLGSCENL